MPLDKRIVAWYSLCMMIRTIVLSVASLVLGSAAWSQRVSCTASQVSAKQYGSTKPALNSYVARCVIFKGDKVIWARDLSYPIGQKRHECLRQIDEWLDKEAPKLVKQYVTQEASE